MMTKAELPVTASIIAYNEEAIISEAVAHILPFVREVIICDTGSTDGTRDVATEAGARVIEIGWNQDFAAARNKALAASKTDWAITIDCDERMSDELIGIIPNLIGFGNGNGIAAFYFWRISVFDGQNVGNEYQPRLLNRQRATWMNKIHEGISMGNGFMAKQVPKEFVLIHEHTMKKQLWANKLYYNINNGIDVRPDSGEGCQYNDELEKWVDVEIS